MKFGKQIKVSIISSLIATIFSIFVLNDPISNKIINKVYIPVFNKYDDKYEPLINKESMIKLFNNNFDIPIDNVFKKKTKNGLYMCFYIDNYIESLSYTSQGTIIKNEDTIKIIVRKNIFLEFSKYKNIVIEIIK